jgi:hypothetical protein
MNDEQIAGYVREHTPELDAQDVIVFMHEHPLPDGEPVSHVAWAVSVLRQRNENMMDDGPSVDRVAGELRRLGDSP